MRQNSISIQNNELMEKKNVLAQVAKLQSKDKLAKFNLNGEIGPLNSRHFGLS